MRDLEEFVERSKSAGENYPSLRQVAIFENAIDPIILLDDSKRLTPSRLPAESRPLREEPPAFLCAIVLLRSLF